MKTIFIFIVLIMSFGFSQTALDERFSAFDPFVKDMVMNMFSDMNIITSDCPTYVTEGFVAGEDVSSFALVCGTLSLGGALELFTNAWNRNFNTHATNWQAYAPWDKQSAGNSEMVFRAYNYPAVTTVLGLAVIYTSDGLVILTVESIDY